MAEIIVNPDDVDSFIRLACGRLGVEERAWADRHLRRFLMRDPRCRSSIRGRLAEATRPGVGSLHSIRQKGGRPAWFFIPPEVEEEAGRVLDWIGSLHSIDPRLFRKIGKIRYEDARSKSCKWHESLSQREGRDVRDDPSGIEAVLSFDDGWGWVRLTTTEALVYEGAMMRHCVGDGAYDRMRTEIYSLRDENNEPHCTVEFDVDRCRIQQARGKANCDVPERHMERLEALLGGLRPKRLNTRLSEFVVTEDGGILRVSHAGEWAPGTRIYAQLTLTNRDDVGSLPEGLHVNGSLIVANCSLERLPRNLTVCQALAGLSLSPIRDLPEGLTVRDLNLEDSAVKSIAPGTRVLRELNLVHSSVRRLPPGLSVGELLLFDGKTIRELPPDMTVKGQTIGEAIPGDIPETTVIVGDPRFADLVFDRMEHATVFGNLSGVDWPDPEFPGRLTVYGNLDLTGALLGLEAARSAVVVHGDLILKGTGVHKLPERWQVRGRLVLDE
ncbi:MAG: PcfJ domain-containing protein [Rhodospirillales bacterium]|nr:PcfJ domain-containing protein [Rhodospirillales bacterium]